ncbi:MBL fold metallo-hydrolase [Paucibacter sp. PLA-PC-4]|uniref:ComEC/Rec2 family competence protein n=1 Tax=Paucibacter sp. PLA-PC-4 TaxID=2993655 RepID=UPI00224949D0|nr:MBL fold metallo-hydrolase [Paucibacter sp. PLA-PC-4]MCX2862261.1 MBL fold metallo-hydrolase [Paucibacter sp. PLA-PC-4]
MQFDIHMLPAKHGDALWIEYGDGTKRRRVLVDAGPINAWQAISAHLDKLPDDDRNVELLVITHVDTDHIEGVIRLLAPPVAKWLIQPQEIWFNGYEHMRSGERPLGGKHGEFLSALLHRRNAASWNKAFKGEAVMLPDSGCLIEIPLADGMKLTLLSPNRSKLLEMATQWERDVAAWEADPGDLESGWEELVKTTKYHGSELSLGPEDITDKLQKQLRGHDGSKANGSSIAFLASYRGRTCLFLADAHADIVCDSIRKMLVDGQAFLKVDAVKVSHHGSRNNITSEFMELVDADHWLISTNGDVHGLPNEAAIEAIIVGARSKPTLWFNYRSKFTEPFERDARHGVEFQTRYPGDGQEGLRLSLFTPEQ